MRTGKGVYGLREWGGLERRVVVSERTVIASSDAAARQSPNLTGVVGVQDGSLSSSPKCPWEGDLGSCVEVLFEGFWLVSCLY